MKKTLILTALLGGMTAQAEIVEYFAKGYDATNIRTAPYHNQMVGNMCWAANASNVLAWWQDQLVAQGYKLPADTPTGTSIYDEFKAAFPADGGYTDNAIEWWLTTDYVIPAKDASLGKHYEGLLNQPRREYKSDGSTLIGQSSPGEQGNLKAYSSYVVNRLQSDCALTMRVSKGYNITVWGVVYDTDSQLLTHLYYSDPHDSNVQAVYRGELTPTDIEGVAMFTLQGNMGTVSTTTSITSRIEEFLTEAAYTDLGGGAFSPVYNVEVDNGTGYTVSKELKAAAKGSALEGVVNGDITIKDGTATMAEGGSTQGAVVFTGTTDKSRTLSVQRDGLTLTSIQVDATAGTNTLAVAEGKTVTVTAMSGEGSLVKTGNGTLVNGGSLGNIELREGALKGSGTFANVAVNGGRLIVGNSPGRQTYTGNLSVNLGEIVFSVDGWETPATGDNCGWASGTYSNIVMNGGSLTLGDGNTLEFALGGGAMATLLANPSTAFNLTIATGFGNGNEFTSELLQQLALQTVFTFSTEDGAFTDTRPEFKDGETLNTHITNLEYKLVDNTKLCVTGVYWRETPPVPEPATGVLSLLGLCALAARRRR